MRRIQIVRQKGFTLLELMVTMAMAGVVLALGVPNLRDFIERNHTRNDANRFVSDINFAKAMASDQVRNVTLRPRSGTDWNSGWNVFIDDDLDGLPDAGTVNLRVRDPLEDGYSLASAGASTLTVLGNAQAFAVNNVTILVNQVFTICGPRGTFNDTLASRVSIALNSRAETRQDGGGGC